MLSFKTIYLNEYNITVLDISESFKENAVFSHESFQLWESPCYGFLVPETKDFVHLNRDGVGVATLSNTENKKILEGNDMNKKVCHSLESLNYVKVDPRNFIEFNCSDPENLIVQIQQK